jgi:aspartyl-tRNA(Asn)/glutamyl-tRNA(Gln) amidotransferase subunit B
MSAGGTGRIGGADYSLVDFNRGGTPLVEIVTGPDVHSSEDARRFLQLLRQTIVELGISTPRWRRGRCASTPTSLCARRDRRSCALAAS